MRSENNNEVENEIEEEGEEIVASDQEDEIENIENAASPDLQVEEQDKDIKAMLEYFKLLDASPASISIATQEALTIILEQLTRNDDNNNEDDPAIDDLFTKSKATVRKKMLELIAGRVPKAERLHRVGDATLKKWLRADNLSRIFMFQIKDALVQYAAIEFGKRLNSNLSYDAMIKELVVEKKQASAVFLTTTSSITTEEHDRHSLVSRFGSVPQHCPCPSTPI